MKTLADLYELAARRFGDRTSFLTRKGAAFGGPTFAQLYEQGLDLATALIQLGVEQREHVALIADNRLEWMIADYGVILAGAADVPRGTDITDSELKYILNHAECRVAFLENEALVLRVEALRSELPQLRQVILLSPESRALNGTLHILDLIEQGRVLRREGNRSVEVRRALIAPQDLFTLIYTSGTTGAPKGVMLTHAAMISQIQNLPMTISPNDRVLSILPVWHIFERVFEMIAIHSGCATYYTNVRRLREDLALVRPTFMASAPRLWESIYAGVMSKMAEASGLKRGLFRAALFTSERVRGSARLIRRKELRLERESILGYLLRLPWALLQMALFLLPWLLLDLVVLSKIRGAAGGKLRASVSGGGALPMHIDLFFNNIGIPVLEGYGLTETCPVVAVRSLNQLVVGTVGPLYANTELRLVDLTTGEVFFTSDRPNEGRGRKGEIHVRGPQVMRGYFRNKAATELVLSADGWFNTGDLGIMTFNNCLKLVGRSKETIVLMSGENVEPVPIENKLLQSPLIDHVMVVGQDRKFLGALIVPAASEFRDVSDDHAVLAESSVVRTRIRAEVKRLVSGEHGFKGFERVVDVALLPKTFVVGDELTAKLSLKRHVIWEKYSPLAESIWSERETARHG